MLRKLLLVGLMLGNSVHTMDTSENCEFDPDIHNRIVFEKEFYRTENITGDVSLCYDKDKGFIVEDSEGECCIERYNLDDDLKKLKNYEDVIDYGMQRGRFQLRKHGNEYKLSNATGLEGGGQLLAMLFYGITKASIHAAIAIGLTKVANKVCDGAGAGPVSGATGMAAGHAIDVVTETSTGSGAMVGLIESQGWQDEAVQALPFVATVHHAAPAAATMAAEVGPIEAICLAAYNFGASLPGW